MSFRKIEIAKSSLLGFPDAVQRSIKTCNLWKNNNADSRNSGKETANGKSVRNKFERNVRTQEIRRIGRIKRHKQRSIANGRKNRTSETENGNLSFRYLLP